MWSLFAVLFVSGTLTAGYWLMDPAHYSGGVLWFGRALFAVSLAIIVATMAYLIVRPMA